MVPVTTMEEVPVLTAKEQAELVASLEEAEARARAGQAIDFNPVALKNRLLKIHRTAKRTPR
jgi:hypothetical protein